MRCAALAFVLATALFSQTPPASQEWVLDSDEVFPGNFPRDGDGNPTRYASLFCDLETGLPLAGARTWSLMGGPNEPQTWRLDVADRDGWIRRDAIGTGFVYGEAPGRAPLWLGPVFCGTGRSRFEPVRWGSLGLARGGEIVLEVRDVFDRPVAGARVEVGFSEGVGGPPIRIASTDGQGRCSVPMLEQLDVTVGASRFAWTFEGRRWDWHSWKPGMPPLILRLHQPAGTGVSSAAETRPGPRIDLVGVPAFGPGPYERSYQVFTENGVEIAAEESVYEDSFSIPLPATGPGILHVHASGRTKIAVLPREAGVERAAPVRLHWFEPARMTVRLVDSAGSAVEGWVEACAGPGDTDDVDYRDYDAEDRPPARTEHNVTIHRRGEVWLQACPAKPGLLRPVRQRISVPWADRVCLDPLVIRLPTLAESRIRVLLPDGSPASSGEYQLMREGHVAGGCDLDAQGAISDKEPAYRDGDVVRVEHDGLPIPFHPRISGCGPWTVQWPRSGLRIHVRDPDRADVRGFVVTLDRHVLHSTPGDDGVLRPFDGTLEIPGLAPGPHRLVIAAPGHRARIQQLVLREGEVREIDAVLRPQK